MKKNKQNEKKNGYWHENNEFSVRLAKCFWINRTITVLSGEIFRWLNFMVRVL